MSELPSDSKRIRARLCRYERQLRAEKTRTGFVDDGAGLRFLVGPLYLLLGALEGAAKSYAWFEKQFPDDGGEPGNDLCWALVLYRIGSQEAAERKLRQVMLRNLYLLPQLLGVPRKPLAIWHGSNWAEADYLACIPPEYWDLWDAAALEWVRRLYESEAFRKAESRYIAIYKELRTLPPGPRRSALVHEARLLDRNGSI
jgi:hypothetical protein